MDSVHSLRLDLAKLVLEPLGHLIVQVKHAIGLLNSRPNVGIGPLSSTTKPAIDRRIEPQGSLKTGQRGAVLRRVAVARADPALDLVQLVRLQHEMIKGSLDAVVSIPCRVRQELGMESLHERPGKEGLIDTILDQHGHLNEGMLCDQGVDLLLGHRLDFVEQGLFCDLPCLFQVLLQGGPIQLFLGRG